MQRSSIAGVLGVSIAALIAAFPFATAAFGRDGVTSDGAPVVREDPSRTPADVAMDIDFLVAAAWEREGLTPAAPCDDVEFCRRVYLDIVGTIPTGEQVSTFAKDDHDQKRARLVDELLASPGYARHATNLWGRVLVGDGTNDNNRDYVPGLFRRWLEQQFEADRPYAAIVTDLLTATGTAYESGPTNYGGRRDHSPTDLAGAVSKHFLGVQIQCAQCHDHPYEDITQADFNGFAAFWASTIGLPEEIDYSVLGPRAAERAEKQYRDQVAQLVQQGKSEDEARQMAARRRPKTRNVRDLETLQQEAGPGVNRRLRRYAQRRDLGEIAELTPKFLRGPEWEPTQAPTRRAALASWITDPTNPYTARALANRYWGWLLGRGFVHPIDDFSSVNIPSIPAALDVLAADTADHGFDLKRLIRVVTSTRAYQLSSAVPGRTPHSDEFFAAGPLKELSPQQTFDSLQVALGVRADGSRMSGLYGGAPSSIDMTGGRGGMMMGADGTEMSRTEQLLAGAARAFFQTFDDDEGGDADAFTGTVPQGLFLLNSDVMNNALVQRNISVIPKIVSGFDRVPDRVTHLFLRTLSREPTAQELKHFTHFVKQADAVTESTTSDAPPADAKRKRGRDRERGRVRTAETREHAAYADLFWALLASSEFSTNH